MAAGTSSTIRHASLWLSFIHACLVLLLVPIAVMGQAWIVGSESVWDEQHWNKFQMMGLRDQFWALCEALMLAKPTVLHQFISGFAGFYYTVDLLLIWANVHPIDMTLKIWYSFHHILCFIGLTVPVFVHESTFDIDFAYVGFFVGEISNPPRCIVDLLEYQIDTQCASSEILKLPENKRFITVWGRRYNVADLKKKMQVAARYHLILFIIFRFVGVQFFAVSYPYVQHTITAWMGGTTLALSLMAMVVMIQGATKGPEVPVKQITKKVE